MAQAARSIENALTIGQIKGQHDLPVRLNCRGRLLGDQTDGLVCLDANGYVPAANHMARIMMPELMPKPLQPR